MFCLQKRFGGNSILFFKCLENSPVKELLYICRAEPMCEGNQEIYFPLNIWKAFCNNYAASKWNGRPDRVVSFLLLKSFK